MPTTAEMAAELYARLRPDAVAAYDKSILAYTPAELQTDMAAVLAADDMDPLNPLVSSTAHGASIAVHDLADAPVAGSPGVATVAGGVLTKINLTV